MLEFFKYFLIVSMFICCLWLIINLFRQKKPIKTFALSAVLGIASLIIVNVLGKVIGDTLEINLYTLGCSTILGIPGVILLVIIKVIWLF